MFVVSFEEWYNTEWRHCARKHLPPTQMQVRTLGEGSPGRRCLPHSSLRSVEIPFTTPRLTEMRLAIKGLAERRDQGDRARSDAEANLDCGLPWWRVHPQLLSRPQEEPEKDHRKRVSHSCTARVDSSS